MLEIIGIHRYNFLLNKIIISLNFFLTASMKSLHCGDFFDVINYKGASP